MSFFEHKLNGIEFSILKTFCIVELPKNYTKTSCFAIHISNLILQINDDYILKKEEYYQVTSDTDETLTNYETLKLKPPQYTKNMVGLLFVSMIIIIYFSKMILYTNSVNFKFKINDDDFQFVYITDIHLDSKYIPSSSTKTFCRKFDEKYVQKPFYYGQYNCDAPFALFHSMLRFINTKIYPKNYSAYQNLIRKNTKKYKTEPSMQKPSFVILGGDLSGHFLQQNMSESHSYIAEIVNNVSISFNGYSPNYKDHFGKYNQNEIPILVALGNNEYAPNYGGLNYSTDKQNFASLYDHVLGPIVLKDKSFSNNHQQDDSSHDKFVQRQKLTFLKGGYYFYDFPKAKLRLLILNTVIYHTRRIESKNAMIESKNIKESLDKERQEAYLEIIENSKSNLDIQNITKNVDDQNRMNNTNENNLNNVEDRKDQNLINNTHENNLNIDYDDLEIDEIDDEDDEIDFDDPYGQFQWIINVSKEAQNTLNYTVGIVLHMPPGSTHTNGDFSRLTQGWSTEYINKFDEILSTSNIEFIISGHSHYDMFLPINGRESRSGQISIVSPSVSPLHENNPGFRIFKLSRQGQLTDYYQYYADILNNPRPNIKSLYPHNVSRGLKWKLSYTFQQAYGNALFSRFAKDESPNEIDDDMEDEDINDFPQYNISEYNVTSNKSDEIYEIKKMPKNGMKSIAINKDSLAKVIEWIATTNEGKWKYKQRVLNMAGEHDRFYKCILFSTTLSQIYECLGSIP